VISGYRKRPPPKESPEAREIALRGHSLLETHENSNYILLRIPVEINNLAHGEKASSFAEDALPSFLPLCAAAITQLQDRGLIGVPRQGRRKRVPVDYVTLRQTYARMLAEGPFSNQTELARHSGVSRIWVSRVLKGIKRKAGQPWLHRLGLARKIEGILFGSTARMTSASSALQTTSIPPSPDFARIS